jgi:2-oxoglutarate ferredoxin oxidoreductase subunit alpha
MASRNEIVVRFAGEGGQGVVTAAELLARAATAVGYHALTFATFPSQILGGPTWTQARLSTEIVRSPGDSVDVLVAFNEEAYSTHEVEVRDGGVVMHDPSFTPKPRDGIKSFAIPFDELAKQTGESRSANMVVLGALAHLVSMPQQYLETFLESRFAGRDEVIKANLMALSLGKDQVKDEVPVGDLGTPNRPDYEQIFIKGNDALSIGALAAGLDYYVGYPISPATPILIFMERHLVGEGKFAYQVSSEIEAIGSLLGGGFSGRKAMTATSGPGFSLMSEGIGLSWMTEIPLVVVDVQRGGPATGLPTKTEQSDLLAALHPAHGDVELPVIAPGTVEECFYAAITAINWAERYQGPVIILSEHSLAERAQNIPKPDVASVKPETRNIYNGDNGYLRYDARELSPMPIPGSPGAYIANGSEHDSYGDTTHLPSRHVQMTERRFSKLKLLEDGTFESENTKEPIALMTWGGSKGSTRDTYESLKEEGVELAWYYTMFINPLPPALLKELRQKELVIVPELNYLGQFASRLRSLGVNAEAITQYTGLPFRVSELGQRIKDHLGSSAARMVKA